MQHVERRNETYDTQGLWHKDRDHVIHPWSSWPAFKREGSLVVVEGQGAYVYDSDGRRYLDATGGLWCVNIGYGRDEMAQAIAEQVRRLAQYGSFADTTNPPAVELAAKVIQYTPGPLNHVFFTNSGSTANDSAIRIVHNYFIQTGRPEKKHIISRRDAYHGTTYLAASLSGRAAMREAPFHFVEDIIHYVSSPNRYRRPEGTTLEQFCDRLVEELEDKIREIGAERVAAFIAEPVMGIGGVLEPPPGYHQRTLEVCRKYDVLYISDEVITGFGRLGHMMASEEMFGIVPDIICCAKGITSGYQPLGATIVSDEIFDGISSAGAAAPFAHGYTYTAHPVCCAAGLKNLEIYEDEKICEHVREVGPYFEEKVAALMDLPLVGDARGLRSIFCVEHVADKVTKVPLPADADLARRLSTAARDRGLLIRVVGTLAVISPPLILDRTQIDDLVDTVRECEEVVTKDLIREGMWAG